MAKVDGSLGSLIQGVSQQPARARLPGQSEEQINVVNDPVFGASRRPGMAYHADYNAFGTDPLEHGEFRFGEKTLRYAIRLSETAVGMHILEDGVLHDVAINTNVEDYLMSDPAGPTFGNNFIVREMDDKIYLVNRQMPVAMHTGGPLGLIENQTVCYIRGGKYASAFTMDFTLPGGTHQIIVATNDGSLAAHTSQTTVKAIAADLYRLCSDAPVAADGSAPDRPALPGTDPDWVPTDGLYYATAGARDAIQAAFNITTMGEYLIFEPIQAALTYNITCTETSGSDLFEDVRDTIKSVGKLPNRAPVGMAVKIEGSNRKEDDYYLRWEVEGFALGETPNRKGRWVECTAPREDYRMDARTLPHEIYWTGFRYSVRQMTWADRDAGNDLSNPPPKLVGDTISEIVDFQQRCTFFHGEDMTTSRSEEYTNLFKETATAELDTDPINIRSTATDGDSQIVYAVQFNRDLVLFATNNAQFMVSGRSTMTPATASMILTSEFSVSLATKPQVVGSSIMFLSNTGKFTGLHEMFLMGDQESHDRRTVTDHVPRYLSGPPRMFTADDGSNMAAVVCDDRSAIYVYQFLWQDNRRVQSAWNTWRVSGEVQHLALHDGVMRIVVKTVSGAFITSDIVVERPDIGNLDHHLHLDQRQLLTLAAEDTIDVECSGATNDLRVVVADGLAQGTALQVVAATQQSVVTGPNVIRLTLAEPYTGDVFVGEVYKTRLVPTMPIMRDRDGVAITEAKLTVSDFTITFRDSGPFTVMRASDYEQPADYWTDEYTGRTLGDPNFQLGTVPMDSGAFTFPFEDFSTTSKLVVECSTHLPMTLTEIEWKGTINNRSRRVTNGG